MGGRLLGKDMAVRHQLQHQTVGLIITCESMCKTVGSYPNCQCPGFGGSKAAKGDDRGCYAKYCHPPADPCPNDGLVTCVEETTALLQNGSPDPMPQVLSKLNTVQEALTQYSVKFGARAADKSTRQYLAAQVYTIGITCESMCKTVGSYPNCQCPGFGGSKAAKGDDRGCYAKYCHPPADPCPNDGLVTCVEETTSLLQNKTVPELLQDLGAAQKAIAKMTQ